MRRWFHLLLGLGALGCNAGEPVGPPVAGALHGFADGAQGVSAFATNRFTSPLWHLVAYTNVPPTEGFLYGQLIAGMRPGITNSHPQPLEPVTAYRLFVEAGRAKGQIDFQTSGIIEPAN